MDRLIVNVNVSVTLAVLGLCCLKLVAAIKPQPQPLGIDQYPALQLSAFEGDDIFLPCFSSPDSPIVFWTIDSSVYAFNALPYYIQPTENGLIIHNARLAAEGEYKCYTIQKSTWVPKLLKPVTTFDILEVNRSKSLPNKVINDGKLIRSTFTTRLDLNVSTSTYIYIPCITALGDLQSDVYFWQIDGAIFSLNQLPENHFVLDDGLYVYVESLSTIGTTYKCYSVSYAVSPQLEFTISLNVSKKEPQPPPEDNNEQFYLSIFSRSVVITSTSIEFSVKMRNDRMNENENCKLSELRFDNVITLPDGQNLTNSSYEYPAKFSVQKAILLAAGSSGYIGAYNQITEVKCYHVRYRYFFQNLSTDSPQEYCVKKNTGCVPIPSQYFLYVIWPQYPNSSDDCLCPVYESSNNPYVPTFKECACIDRNMTSYNVTKEGNFLCWNNLTEDQNDTKVLFVNDTDGGKKRFFFSQSRLILQGPNVTKPNITQPMPGGVCVDGTDRPDWSPTVQINITISDITEDLILKRSYSSAEICIQLFNFPFFNVCSPYTFNTTASTLCAQSPEATLRVEVEHASRNACACLTNKVSIFMRNETIITSNSITAYYVINCLKDEEFDIHTISNLHLIAMSVEDSNNRDNIPEKAFDIVCSETERTLTISNLDPGAWYNLSIIWRKDTQISKLSLNSLCHIGMSKMIRTADMSVTAGEIVGPIAATVVITCVLGGLYVYYRRKKNPRAKDKGHSESSCLIRK